MNTSDIKISPDLIYKMNHPKRGVGIIFNHVDFNAALRLERIEGTEVDCNSLRMTLEKLKFDVEISNDFTYKEIMSKLDEVAEKYHKLNDCLFIAVLTHGREQGVLYSKDREYNLEDIINKFTADKCPVLAGKPKLFFIEACRGNREDAGALLDQRILEGNPKNYSQSIPIYADFLIAYSTFSNHVSFFHQATGAWFIQSLCKELDENGNKIDLLTLLTFVNRRVAYEYGRLGVKQIPCITSMLTAILKFDDKITTS